jgi:hypothetical protein
VRGTDAKAPWFWHPELETLTEDALRQIVDNTRLAFFQPTPFNQQKESPS